MFNSSGVWHWDNYSPKTDRDNNTPIYADDFEDEFMLSADSANGASTLTGAQVGAIKRGMMISK
jgi:hypothetical protein